MNGDLLVSMLSLDKQQSIIVMYSWIRENQIGILGDSLLSIYSWDVLRLSENGNGDICVADYTGQAVLVVYAFGGLRFKYTGNKTIYKKNTSFKPLDIDNDENFNILIGDESNNLVHIIDCDGNFICYIECTGGISIDTDHNLVVGEEKSGKILIIKYLE